MSSRYSNQPEFGDDPYSYIIGKPRSKRESHKAMESWTDSQYHPSCGTSTIRLHNWERSRRGVSFGDPREDGVYELSTTYINSGTGVVEDVHGHYILGGTLLEKVKRDFDRYVIGSWQTARQYDKEFPHHTIVKLSRVLDPTKDPQPKYMNTGAYIEVKSSDMSDYSDMCVFSSETPKGTSSFQGTIYYSFDGKVGRTESYITRNTYRDFVVKTFVGGLFDAEYVEYIYDSKYGVIKEMDKVERRRLMTAKDRIAREEARRRERKLEQERKRAQREKEADERRRRNIAARARRARKAKAKRDWLKKIDSYIVEHYVDNTSQEIARALDTTVEEVEQRIARLGSRIAAREARLERERLQKETRGHEEPGRKGDG